jgi:putative colanic acid biosynthesis UDP-glucose lipid carrier transferase
LNRYRPYLYFFRQFFDYLLIVISFILASILSIGDNELTRDHQVNEALLLILLLFTWFFYSRTTNIYDEFRSRNFSFELVILTKNILVQTIISIILIFFIKEINFSRLFVLYYSFLLFILLFIEKYFLNRYLIFLRYKGRNIRTVLIIGAGKVGKKFFYTINDNPHFGYKVIGFLDDFEIQMLSGKYLGSISELYNVLNTNDIDNVIVALPNYATEKIQEVIHICELNGKKVRIIPDYFRFASSRYNVSMFGPFPVVAVKDMKIDQYNWRFWKRLIDLSFSLLVTVLILSWLYPLLGLIIKINSKGPVIFKQERWGRDNKKFLVYKFRSMFYSSNDVDQNGNYIQAKLNDSRITTIGRVLRKTNLDELPQFINVLKGEMSLVGPRPHPTPLNLEAKQNISHYLQRHYVKPGITGWAQVHGLRGETQSEERMQKRVEYDLYYIENWSPFLDFQIILLTAWQMLKGDKNAY